MIINQRCSDRPEPLIFRTVSLKFGIFDFLSSLLWVFRDCMFCILSLQSFREKLCFRDSLYNNTVQRQLIFRSLLSCFLSNFFSETEKSASPEEKNISLIKFIINLQVLLFLFPFCVKRKLIKLGLEYIKSVSTQKNEVLVLKLKRCCVIILIQCILI